MEPPDGAHVIQSEPAAQTLANAACPKCGHGLRDATKPECPACGLKLNVTCSLCNYDLQGLPTPRCPECGQEFDWNQKLREALQGSEFLFEHQWRRRPLRSYFATTFAAAPWRFWKQVSIHQTVHIGPLLFLTAITAPQIWPAWRSFLR